MFARPSRLHLGTLAGVVFLCAACSAPTDHTSVDGLDPETPPAAADSILLSPAAPVVAVGQPVQFTAPTRSVRGETLSGDVTWSASGGTIDAGGVFMASTTGTYTVTAERGTKRGKTKVTVSPPAPAVAQVVVAPEATTLQAGESLTFAASGRSATGETVPVTVSWAATGGTIQSTGVYAAGATTGTYRVVAVHESGLADTASVTITAPAPTLTAIEVSPASASLQTGGAASFTATGRLSNGATTSVTVTWSATGGAIGASGDYVAPGSAGTYHAIARTAGGFADTATITVAAPPPATPPFTPTALFPNAPSTSGWLTVTDLQWDVAAVPYRQNPVYDPDNGSHLVEYGYNGNLTRYASVVDDADLPFGPKRALHYRMPANMPGGGAPSIIGQHPDYRGDGALRWSPSLNTGHLYIGYWVRFSPDYSLNGNVAQKVLYLKSDTTPNRDIAHMPGINMNDGNGGNQLWPEYQPQHPFGNYGPSKTTANNLNDGRWHLVELLQGPNTPGVANGTLKLWIDGRLEGNWTNAKFFDVGQVPSLNRLEIAPIYGGGLNPVPKEQWIRLGPVLVRSR